MSNSKFVDFKTVKAAVSMEQVLQHYGLLGQFTQNGNGDSLSGPCPIHKGTNPTQFRVSLTKNCWNCFGDCKGGGNVLDFVARLEHITLHAAAVSLCQWFNLDGETPRQSKSHQRSSQTTHKLSSTKRAQAEAVSDESTPNKPLLFQLENLDRSHPYLAERGLTAETIVDFGVGYCSKGLMAGRVAIPIYSSDGQTLAYAGRWPGNPPEGTPKYKLPAGFRKSLELFNLDRAIKEPDDHPLVIVEGFFDCIKLWQHGLRRVIAIMGSTLSPAQEELIRKNTNSTSRVLVMLDEDDAGRAGRDDIARRLTRFCYVKIHSFENAGVQPEHLSAEQVRSLIGGAS